MYQNAALFFKKHNSVSKNTIRFSKTQFNFRNTIQFQKYNSISKTQFNFTTTTFIPHSLITQFNFQKHFSIFKSTIQFQNTIRFHDHKIHSIFTENTTQFSKPQVHMKTHLKI